MENRLIRLVYASRATFKPFDVSTEGGFDGHVVNILNTARKNNKKRNLVGALYYGNGCFFQCLEGEKKDIDALHAILLQDPRHQDIKILSSNSIEKIGFGGWEMKFATVDHEVRSFLRQNGIAKFDPYKFTPEMVDELVNVLQKADDGIATDALVKMAGNLPKLPVISSGTNISFAQGVLLTLFGAVVLIAVIYFQM